MAFDPLKLFVQENSWTLLVSFMGTMVTLFALYVKRKRSSTNLVLLTLFTLMQAYTIAMVVSMFDVTTVLEALFMTLTVTIGLTIYTFSKQTWFVRFKFRIIYRSLDFITWWFDTNISSKHYNGTDVEYRRSGVDVNVHNFRYSSDNAYTVSGRIYFGHYQYLPWYC